MGSSVADWPEPCEKEFQAMAVGNPLRLIGWIESGELKPSRLTYAAEALGSANLPEVRWILVGLLDHESPLVREGALYGLARQPRPLPAMLSVLRRVAEVDPSPGVRSAAQEILECYA